MFLLNRWNRVLDQQPHQYFVKYPSWCLFGDHEHWDWRMAWRMFYFIELMAGSVLGTLDLWLSCSSNCCHFCLNRTIYWSMKPGRSRRLHWSFEATDRPIALAKSVDHPHSLACISELCFEGRVAHSLEHSSHLPWSYCKAPCHFDLWKETVRKKKRKVGHQKRRYLLVVRKTRFCAQFLVPCTMVCRRIFWFFAH